MDGMPSAGVPIKNSQNANSNFIPHLETKRIRIFLNNDYISTNHHSVNIPQTN